MLFALPRAVTVTLGLMLIVAASPVRANPANPMRLPTGVAPVTYRLKIDPDIDRQTFEGTEEVDIDVATARPDITLNAAALTFSSVTLDNRTDEAKVTLDADRQEATFHFDTPVGAGRHTLKIRYAGLITEEGRGLYLDKYQSDGPRKMLVTQFESIDARRMFPGWDEPDAKAVFELTAIAPKTLTVVSNMPIRKQTDLPNGKVEVSFAPTPKMSTYLLVLIEGEFDRISKKVGSVDIGVVVPKGLSAKGQWALDSLDRLLPYYNEYYGTPYPLPKLDLIAVPGNYTAGAMENWGGITFIDSAILLDPKASSEGTREGIFIVIAHEVAHQWTGDLVTMRWWDDLWLNEAFAEWMNFHATDALNPDWHIFARGPAELGLDRAIGRDSGRASHPIYRPVTDISETELIFDSITYQKGAAVLRMLETWLGPDVFRDGMRAYFKEHAYGNAERADLWRALSKVSGQNVATVAEGFVTQAGLPDVAVSESCADGKLNVSLTQGRFTIHYPNAPETRWNVPILIGRVGEEPKKLVLGTEPQTVQFDGCDHPAKVNWGVVGYYHVTYDAPTLGKIAAGVAALPPADQANVLNDAWLSVEAGKLDAAAWFDLAGKFSGSTQAAVWNTILDAFGQTDRVLRGTPAQQNFRLYARSLLAPQLASLGWVPQAGEPAEYGTLRQRVIGSLGRFGDPAVIAEAKRRFAAFPADPAAMPGGIADAVTGVVGVNEDPAIFDRLHALAVAAPDFESKARFFRALSATNDPVLIKRALALALTDEYPPARLSRYIAAIAQRGEHPELVWDFVNSNSKALFAKLPDSAHWSLRPGIASGFDDTARIADIENSPDSQTPGGKAEAANAADDIGAKADFKARVTPQVVAWLKARGAKQ